MWQNEQKLKSNGGQISDKDCFLFSLPAQKLRLDAVSIWQKFLSNRKECKCLPLDSSKPCQTFHQTKVYSENMILQAHMCCPLFSNHIGDQCSLKAINALSCLKTCHQILTNELWNVWRSSNLRGGCSNISHSHTKCQQNSLPTKTRGLCSTPSQM